MGADCVEHKVSHEDNYENEKTTGKEYQSSMSFSNGYMKSSDSMPVEAEDHQCREEGARKNKERFLGFKTDLIWTNVILITLWHLAAAYYFFAFDYLRDVRTLVWMYVMYLISGFGVTGGAHRYWTHKTYKATKAFQVFLVIAYASAAENRIFEWVRDHRVHHKFTDTDADPHNSNRGFFFSHVGWLMMKKHPQVIEKGREIDMSDIKNDRLVTLADKYFNILKIVFCFLLPTMLPVYGWGETWARAFISQGILRYVIMLNCSWSVNSAAHLWGVKPYDKSINPSDNVIVSYLAGGEGWHNYHHVFPWDYKASEWGGGMKNVTTFLLDNFAKFGLVYDQKQPSQELINTVAKRRGDGSHSMWEEVAFDATDANK